MAGARSASAAVHTATRGSRKYAGYGLGAALLDWAADVATRDYGAALIRIDEWTTNLGLTRQIPADGASRPARDNRTPGPPELAGTRTGGLADADVLLIVALPRIASPS